MSFVTVFKEVTGQVYFISDADFYFNAIYTDTLPLFIQGHKKIALGI